MNEQEAFEQQVSVYIAELAGPVPYVSRSHYTLSRLYRLFGEKRVNERLQVYWDEQRVIDAARDKERAKALRLKYFGIES